jgi:hypothetical protein
MRIGALVLTLIALTGQMRRSVAPSPNEGALSDADLEVSQVAIRGFLSSPYGDPYNVTHGGVRMVMPDRTIRVCVAPRGEPYSYDCIRSSDQQAIGKLLIDQFGRNGPGLFRERNQESSLIRRPLDPQFVLSPSVSLLEMLKRPWSQECARRFPGRQGIVMISAPLYSSTRQAAVLYVLHVVGAAAYVRLVRSDAGWSVREVHGLWIS